MLTVLIFAKYPTAGTVNTRMVPPLTSEQAAQLHYASLLTVCENVAALGDQACRSNADQSHQRKGRVAKPRAGAWGSDEQDTSAPGDVGGMDCKLVGAANCKLVGAVDCRLVVTPDGRVDDLRKMVGVDVADCWPQGDGDLGRRLARATDRALSDNSAGVIVLGADSPTLPRGFLERAVTKLSRHAAVVGPCDDGGYYLIGLRRSMPVLFERINWGSAEVARQTGERAVDAGIDLAELPLWYDLDRPEDLTRAAEDLADVTDTTRPAMIALRRLIESYIDG